MALIWYEHIAEFLNIQQLSNILSKNEWQKIRVNNTYFALIAKKLYYQRIDEILRCCLIYDKKPLVLKAYHSSACSRYFFGQLISQKILKIGYFWTLIFINSKSFVRSYVAC